MVKRPSQFRWITVEDRKRAGIAGIRHSNCYLETALWKIRSGEHQRPSRGPSGKRRVKERRVKEEKGKRQQVKPL